MLKGSGKVSHLFWMKQECTDCEFKADVRIMDGANSGMYFRTAFGPRFPKGYEAQVNATHGDPVKTGSLYSFAKNLESPSKPGEPHPSALPTWSSPTGPAGPPSPN